MVNINGKEWMKLTPSDIMSAISEIDFQESFYFEFKDDRVTPPKLMEEVSAFSNTFGGYIFLGISDGKKIDGCTEWNEQKIHTTIHDAITPTPSFDVKKFDLSDKIVYVIKIDEGSEPPYITSRGKIYERLSSGSFVIKDSSKLSQIYSKRELLLAKMEKKVSIPPVDKNANNIYGYIDIGFVLTASDIQDAIDTFYRADLRAIAKSASDRIPSFNLSYVGNSLVYTPGGVSVKGGHMPAHTNNFIEIMADGSARMRILLGNNNPDDSSVNMMTPFNILIAYKKMYTDIFGTLFPYRVAYAKKYESLTVMRQFQPVAFYDDLALHLHPDFQEENCRMMESLQNQRKIYGITTVITDDRIPKTGLYTIDKRRLELCGQAYTAKNFIDYLFLSGYSLLGSTQIWEKD